MGSKQHNMRHIHRIGMVSAIALLMGTCGPAVAASGVPIVKTSRIRDFARITFEWPSKTTFTARTSGNKITIHFSRNAEPDVGRILAALQPHVTRITQGEDGKTIIITLNVAHPIRTFISGNSVGIDIMKFDAASAEPAAGKTDADTSPKKPPHSASEEKKKTPATTATKNSEENDAPTADDNTEDDTTDDETATDKTSSPTTLLKPVVKPGEKSPAKEKPAIKIPLKQAGIGEKKNVTPASEKNTPSENKDIKPKKTPPTKENASPEKPSIPKARPVSAIPVQEKKRDVKAPIPPVAAVSAPPVINPDIKAVETIAPATEKKPALGPASQTAPALAATAIEKTADGLKPAAPDTPTPPRTMNPTENLAHIGSGQTSLAADTTTSADTTPATTIASHNSQPALGIIPTPTTQGPQLPPTTSPTPQLPSSHILHLTAPGLGAAIFTQGQVLWVVLDGPTAITARSIADMAPGLLKADIQPQVSGFTALRFTMLRPLYPSLQREEGQGVWKLQLSERPQRPLTPLTVNSNEENGTSVLTITTQTMGTLRNITDPVSMESFTVIPTQASGNGVFPARHYVDADIPETAQGVVVISRSDAVHVLTQPGRVKIQRHGGLRITPHAPPVDPEDWEGIQGTDGATLFPYEAWKVPAGGFAAYERQLRQKISDAGRSSSVQNIRLDLVKLYLGEGRAQEALGELEAMRTADPFFYAEHKLAAYRGAANFLLYHLYEARDDFNQPELAVNDELQMWRALVNELLGTGRAPPVTAFYPRYVRHYPPALHQKLAIIGADLAIARGDYRTAEVLFDGLRDSKRLEEVKKYVEYMQGLIASKTGQTQTAIATWSKLAGDYADRFVRSRAEYSLVSLLLDQEKISRKDAIKRLEKLRVVWRGDGLELNLLKQLSQLYIDEKDFISGLRTLREVVANFPATPDALAATQRMSQLFVDLFNGGMAKDIPPLDALSLYYEFRELTPIGAAGDHMIQNLADRLVEVDLLERAAGLLNHQVRFRLEEEERSRVGARLALIYLMNRQPQEALETLELTGYGKNPEDLERTRRHLAAQALSGIGKHTEALAMLNDDLSEEAQDLRVNIEWAAKDWHSVAASIEDILGHRKDITAPLSIKESEYLLKLSLAYVFENDRVQLQYLRDYFGPLMKENPNKEVFFFITDSDTPVDHKNFQRLSADITRIRGFLESYQKKVRKSGLSNTI